MSEGIEFKPTGGVVVSFDDKDYTLRRPKLGQWRYFTRQMGEMTKETTDRLTELSQALSETIDRAEVEAPPEFVEMFHVKRDAFVAAPTDRAAAQEHETALAEMITAAPDDVKAAHETAVEAMSEFTGRPFYERTAKLLAEMYTQLSDTALPDDVDEWPAWLATDVTIPGKIITHWRQIPKASGSNGAAP